MAYPSLEQYNLAFQAHSKLLTDQELRSGTVATTGLGLPLAISGGFALTYTIRAGAKKYAVRCFHRKSTELERRYAEISKRIASLRSPYFLDFQFQPKGINVDGAPYPIVKMAWAKGETLGEFLEDNRSSSQALARLSASLEALAAFLEKEKIAHGDVQTGNLMVSDGGATVQLIDYDGMFVEGIRVLGSAELGHVNFQHPKRKTTNPFDSTLDRFSLITLWLALKALREDASVWDKTNSEVDAIVFRANDFIDPASSLALALLSSRKTLSEDARNFAAICASPMERTPSLADFIAGRSIPAPVAEIRITGNASAGKVKPGYVGAYEVLSALDYEACLRHVGDKVEAIGKIVEVKLNRTTNGKPYIFVNFGDWHGRIFKISIWSEGLRALRSAPDPSWEGKWVSIVGLMQPPFRKNNYSHLSITVAAIGQMTVLTEVDAQWRLAGPKGGAQSAQSVGNNREMLDRIKGKSASVPVSSSPVRTAASSNKAILDKIRASSQGAQTGMPPAQARIPPASHPLQPAARPTPGYTPRPAPTQQREKGVIAKILGWLFG